MAATSVRISKTTSLALDDLARATGKSKVVLLAEAVEAMAAKAFWASFDAGYDGHGGEFRAELTAMEGSFNDGLPPIAEEDEL